MAKLKRSVQQRSRPVGACSRSSRSPTTMTSWRPLLYSRVLLLQCHRHHHHHSCCQHLPPCPSLHCRFPTATAPPCVAAQLPPRPDYFQVLQPRRRHHHRHQQPCCHSATTPTSSSLPLSNCRSFPTCSGPAAATSTTINSHHHQQPPPSSSCCHATAATFRARPLP
jgi:hypothetical protein